MPANPASKRRHGPLLQKTPNKTLTLAHPKERAMSHHYALTVIGRDRPGIIAQVTEILFRLGCNIADSSCTLLGGQYAMIQIVSHPTIDSKEEIAAAFAPLEQVGLSAFVRKIDPETIRSSGV